MRTTSTPAWMMPSKALGSSVAGPSVATILVLRNIDVSLHVRARYPPAVLSLLVVWRRFRRRLALRALFQDRDCGQFFTFQKFQKRAAAGRDVRDLVGDAVFRHGRERVAAAGDGECRTLGDGVGERLGALAELGELEYADRAVPDNGAGVLQNLRELFRCLGTDVEDHIVVGDLADLLQLGASGFGKFLAAYYVARYRDVAATRASLFGELARLRDQIIYTQRFADLVAGRGDESVGDAAA